MPEILETQETEAEGSQVEGRPGQLNETLSHNKIN